MKAEEKNYYVAGFGGTNIDLHIRAQKPAVMRDSNFAKIYLSPGGVMRNILDNVARLGISCKLLSALGRDDFGGIILADCERIGIDTSCIYKDSEHGTSFYVPFVDADGDMLIAANDMRNLQTLPEDYLEAHEDILKRAKAIICDANPPEDRIVQLTQLAGDTPIFADPVSTARCNVFLPVLDKIYLLKPNLMELESMSGMQCRTDDEIAKACEVLFERGLNSLVVSLGARGCYYADRNGKSMFRRMRAVENMANATGAGDAFMAGLVCAWCRGADTAEMLDYALA
ncbi:MAG: hypothetical protein GX975_02200, partial [Clostridiales bacterium]|nr:hypothetical protein [Clostridiales bacterium]